MSETPPRRARPQGQSARKPKTDQEIVTEALATYDPSAPVVREELWTINVEVPSREPTTPEERKDEARRKALGLFGVRLVGDRMETTQERIERESRERAAEQERNPPRWNRAETVRQVGLCGAWRAGPALDRRADGRRFKFDVRVVEEQVELDERSDDTLNRRQWDALSAALGVPLELHIDQGRPLLVTEDGQRVPGQRAKPKGKRWIGKDAPQVPKPHGAAHSNAATPAKPADSKRRDEAATDLAPVDPIPLTWLHDQVPPSKVKGDASKLALWLGRPGRRVRVYKVAGRNYANRAELLRVFRAGSKVHELVKEYTDDGM
jgi:hypothetical protein